MGETKGKGGRVAGKIAYVFSANVLSLAISAFSVLILPKFMSLDDYGIWQLFLFYFSYVGFFAFGLEDGIYLRYAGYRFEDLDAKRMAGQYYLDIGFQIAVVAVVAALASVWQEDASAKILALLCAVLLSPLAHLYGLSSLILQMTDRIREYAKLVLLDGVVFFLGACALLTLGLYEFRYFYFAKCLSAICMALGAVYYCRRLLKPRWEPLRRIFREAGENMSVGIKLMLANIANLLIIGNIRYGISLGWDVATFGKVSLTLSLSNFLLVFINSVSVVFFPIIKRMDETRRAEAYREIRDVLTFLLFGALLSYYPLKCVLTWWLPKYADSLVYMSILFPVCVFESKMCLLINTYLKSMRQETLMLKINIGSVLVSLAVTCHTVGVFRDLDLAVFSIVGVYALRCIVAEQVTGKLLGLSLGKEILTDALMCGIFIATGRLFDDWRCMAFYGMAYGMLLFWERDRFRKTLARCRQAA